MPTQAPVICLLGPTATGKTDLAVDLVDHLNSSKVNCEIISVDSALIYRDMDIGTAKPDTEVLEKAPHALLDIRDPSESYSAAEFCEDVAREIQRILAKERIPLLVGGTMLYFHAFIHGLAELPAANPELRQRLEQEASQLGWEHLHQRLSKIDPKAAQRIHPNDPQRIQRALEVYEICGVNITTLQEQTEIPAEHYDLIKFGLMPVDRTVLHARIETRFDQMLAQGFIDEVQKLYSREDLHAQLPSMRAVGYRQAWAYLADEIDREAMREQAIAATRQLAKRQITWMRKYDDIQLLTPLDESNLSLMVEQIASHIEGTNW